MSQKAKVLMLKDYQFAQYHKLIWLIDLSMIISKASPDLI